MGLSWKSVNTESLDNTLGSVTFGDSNGINHLVHGENFTDCDFLFEVGGSPIDLLLNITTVKLDFHDVSLLLSELGFLNLGGADNSDSAAVLPDSVDVSVNVIFALGITGVSLLVVLEGVSLGNVVVLVESSHHLIREVLGVDSCHGSKSSWGHDVADHTNDLDWWALNNRDSLDNIFLDCLLTFSLLEVSNDVGHTGLVSHESSQVNWLGLVILWE